MSYLSGGIRLYEDIKSRMYPALDKYAKLIKLGVLSPQERDIGTLCGLVGCTIKGKQYAGLEDVIEHHQAHLPVQALEEVHSGLVLDGPNAKIYAPKTEEESCYYGQGTRWCTAAKKDNRFKSYFADGPLYIIIPKRPAYNGEKYQLHVYAGVFYNEKDQLPPSIAEVFERMPEIRSVIAEELEHMVTVVRTEELWFYSLNASIDHAFFGIDDDQEVHYYLQYRGLTVRLNDNNDSGLFAMDPSVPIDYVKSALQIIIDNLWQHSTYLGLKIFLYNYTVSLFELFARYNIYPSSSLDPLVVATIRKGLSFNKEHRPNDKLELTIKQYIARNDTLYAAYIRKEVTPDQWDQAYKNVPYERGCM